MKKSDKDQRQYLPVAGKIHTQIKQLHSEIRKLYAEEIKQTERDINYLSNKIANIKQKKIQLEQKKMGLNKANHNNGSIHRQQLENQRYIDSLNQLIKKESAKLHNKEISLIKQKNGLAKSLIEEQVLKDLNKTNDINNGLKKTIHLVGSDSQSDKTNNNKRKPNSISFIHQLSSPPIPTDGPDQLQGEADFNAGFHNKEFNISSNGHNNFLSAFSNYLVDDELDDDPEI